MDNLIPIIIPHRVLRSFVVNHREWIFLYSNDYFQQGAEGMAWYFQGEPNAFSIPTCYKMCLSQRHFYDHSFDNIKNYLDAAFAVIPTDGRPIIPMPKMGLGCSRMKELAPKCYDYMMSKINAIKYPNIKISYV